MDTLVLSVADVRQVVASIGLDELMDRTIEGIEAMCRSFARGESQTPQRSWGTPTTAISRIAGCSW